MSLLKGKKATVSYQVIKRVDTNYPFASTIKLFASLVYSKSGLKMDLFSTITDTMNGTILSVTSVYNDIATAIFNQI